MLLLQLQVIQGRKGCAPVKEKPLASPRCGGRCDQIAGKIQILIKRLNKRLKFVLIRKLHFKLINIDILNTKHYGKL